MATKLLTKYKQRIKGLELQPADGGCFEVTAAGDLVYSKLQTGSFPDEDTVIGEIGKML